MVREIERVGNSPFLRTEGTASNAQLAGSRLYLQTLSPALPGSGRRILLKQGRGPLLWQLFLKNEKKKRKAFQFPSDIFFKSLLGAGPCLLDHTASPLQCSLVIITRCGSDNASPPRTTRRTRPVPRRTFITPFCQNPRPWPGAMETDRPASGSGTRLAWAPGQE